MGKRFTIGYTVSIVPNVAPLDETSEVGVSFMHSLGLSYVVARRKEISIATGYYNTIQSIDNVEVGTVEMSFGLKLYSRARYAFAPLGPYIKWELLARVNTIHYPSYTDEVYNSQNGTNTHVSRGAGSISYNSFGAAWGFGKQRVFFDRLVLDYGLRLGVTVPVDGTISIRNQHERIIYNASRESGLLHQVVGFRIGLGFLAF